MRYSRKYHSAYKINVKQSKKEKHEYKSKHIRANEFLTVSLGQQ